MATPISFQQLPARCIVVNQQAWCFVVEIVSKGNSIHTSHILCSAAQLATYVNDWQLRKAGDVYRRIGHTWSFELLSYEQAVELYRAELKNN